MKNWTIGLTLVAIAIATLALASTKRQPILIPPHASAPQKLEGSVGQLSKDSVSIAPAVWDLGDVPPGKQRHDFSLTNNLDEQFPLISRADCDCVRIVSCPDHIAPRSRARVELEINTERTQGQFVRRCLFTSPGNSQILLPVTIKGIVHQRWQFQVIPNLFDFGKVSYGTTSVTTLKLTSEDPELIKSVDIKSSPPFNARLVPGPDSSSAAIELSFSSDHYPEVSSGQLTVTSRSHPSIIRTVSILARTVGALNFSPAEVLLGRISNGQFISNRVQISGPAKLVASIQLAAVHLPKGLNATAKRISEGSWEVELSGYCHLPPLTPIRGELWIKTNDAGCQRAKIPVLGVIADGN